MTHPAAERIIGLYADRAEDWIRDRGRSLGRRPSKEEDAPTGLSEADWLERFMGGLPAGGSVLDVGCGSGWPVGAALIARGFRVTGVDASPGLLAHAAETLPDGEWIEGDMRSLDLGARRFDGILAWNSLFHLTPDDQRAALPRILAHARTRCVFMTTTGPAEGEAIGEWRGELLYHASLDPEAYQAILTGCGFIADPMEPGEQDAQGGVWLARRGG